MSCFLFGTLLLTPVWSSGPTAHFESHQTKNLREAFNNADDSPLHPLLQLMSVDLNNWGSLHAHAEPVLHSTPILSLMSASLDAWGSNATGSPLADLVATGMDYVGNPLAQVVPTETNLFGQRVFEAHPMRMSFVLEPNNRRGLVSFGLILLVLFLLALLLFCLCNDGNASEDDEQCLPASGEQQQDFASVEFSGGSWAQVYQEARGEQKEALELLFRCNIISTDEFAFSSVSPEHIQECIWIATHMLRQKPLEEWVALWQQAQQTFEDSVAACFEARAGGPHSSSSLPGSFSGSPALGQASPLNLGASAAFVNRLGPSICEGEDDSDPYTTRSHYMPHGPPEDPPLSPLQGMPPLSQTSQNTACSDETRWSIESELNKGLAQHSPSRAQ